VLLKIGSASPEFEDDADLLAAVDAGAAWTAAAVFRGVQGRECVFDEFAEWYTTGGFRENSWLELLDLTKWCI
jgi:hypothetical protein